jgi:hypothetical protein
LEKFIPRWFILFGDIEMKLSSCFPFRVAHCEYAEMQLIFKHGFVDTCFGGSGVGTQGFVPVRQVLYCLSRPSALLWYCYLALVWG